MHLSSNIVPFYLFHSFIFPFFTISVVDVIASLVAQADNRLYLLLFCEQIEEFALRFNEQGTTVREEVDIDVENKTD